MSWRFHTIEVLIQVEDLIPVEDLIWVEDLILKIWDD